MIATNVETTMDYEKYYRNPEPSQRQKAYNWATAIGLQDVDGLSVSPYLLYLAEENIEGRLQTKDVVPLLLQHYESKDTRKEEEEKYEEADLVAARISEILSAPSFSLSSSYYIAIHRKLFSGIYGFAGAVRSYGISKKEWILDGKSVLYGAPFELSMALEYDIKEEKLFSYKGLSLDETISHFSRFISKLWQIHAFGEGNTRTTAVFAIQYLRYMGFPVDNNTFQENSWYFRNALVRANYNDLANGIHETTEYLELFFRNLILGEKNELKTRRLHINYKPKSESSVKTSESSVKTSKSSVKTLELILKILRTNPKASAKEIAKELNLQTRSVEKQLAKLKANDLIRREGPSKGGRWIVL